MLLDEDRRLSRSITARWSCVFTTLVVLLASTEGTAVTPAPPLEPEPGGPELCDAALVGDLEEIEGLLASGTAVDARGNRGMTALMSAATGGEVETVGHLLAAGAKLEAQDEIGRTPLIWAASSAELAVVQQLIEAGADVNRASHNGTSPLLVAAWGSLGREQPAVIQALVDAGADLEAGDADGETALMLAAQGAQIAVAEQLIAAGADVNAASEDGFTVLMSAVGSSFGEFEDRQRVVDRLLTAGADPKSRGGTMGTTALIIAVSAASREPGYETIVKSLLDKGAPLNDQQESFEQNSALHAAAAAGHLEIVRMLLAAGADVALKNRFEKTPLDLATEHDHAPVVEALTGE